MAAYRRVYDVSPAGWLPRTRISSGTLRSVIEYGLPLPFFCSGQMPDWTVLWIVHYDTDHLVSEQYTNTYKKCGFLKKQYFICIKKVNESCQALFDVLYVWYQLINDRWPRLFTQCSWKACFKTTLVRRTMTDKNRLSTEQSINNCISLYKQWKTISKQLLFVSFALELETMCSRSEPLGTSGMGFLLARYLFCHPTNSVKALE